MAEDEQERYSAVWEYSPIQFVQSRVGIRRYNGIPNFPASNRNEWFAELLAGELDGDSDRTFELTDEQGDDDTTRRARPGRDCSHVSFRYSDGRGRTFEPLFLSREDGSETRLAAVLVFHSGRDIRKRPSREVIEELADQMLVHGDVIGAVLPPTSTHTR